MKHVHIKSRVRSILFHISSGALITNLTLFLSVFLYGAFYFTHIPKPYWEETLPLQFTNCHIEKEDFCGYPTARLLLKKSNMQFISGQGYSLSVKMKLPPSQRNRELGMTMICLKAKTKTRVEGLSCQS